MIGYFRINSYDIAAPIFLEIRWSHSSCMCPMPCSHLLPSPRWLGHAFSNDFMLSYSRCGFLRATGQHTWVDPQNEQILFIVCVEVCELIRICWAVDVLFFWQSENRTFPVLRLSHCAAATFARLYGLPFNGSGRWAFRNNPCKTNQFFPSSNVRIWSTLPKTPFNHCNHCTPLNSVRFIYPPWEFLTLRKFVRRYVRSC